MRSLVPLLAYALVAWTPEPVQITAHQCWSLKVGDRVQGTAVLRAYAGSICIECGASVSGGRSCLPIGLLIENRAAIKSYDYIVHSAPADRNEWMHQTVYLSGQVVSYDETGKLAIRARVLRRMNGSIRRL